MKAEIYKVEKKTHSIKEWLNRSQGNTNIIVIVSWIGFFIFGMIIGKLWL